MNCLDYIQAQSSTSKTQWEFSSICILSVASGVASQAMPLGAKGENVFEKQKQNKTAHKLFYFNFMT